METKQMSMKLQEKLNKAETIDDVVRICAEAGITVSKSQLEAAEALSSDEELTEETLDAVSGGGLFSWFRLWKYWHTKRSSGGGGSGSFGGGGGGGGFR